MAPLFSKDGLNKFWHDVQNEVTLICANFGKDLFSISKVIGRKTTWPRFFFGLPCINFVNNNKKKKKKKNIFLNSGSIAFSIDKDQNDKRTILYILSNAFRQRKCFVF